MKKINQVNKTEIYLWNIVGSFTNALSSVVLLILVNRILGIDAGDTFSIAFSIAGMMLVIGAFQVRNYQATDVREKFCFCDYVSFRIITCTVMIIVSVLYVIFKGHSSEKSMVILLLCIFRVIDAFSDVFQALFQQKERLDLSGKSLTIKTVFPTIVFGILLIVMNNLVWACVGMVLTSLFLLIIYDIQVYQLLAGRFQGETIKEERKWFVLKNIKQLFLRCLPLFINGYLIAVVLNAAKLAIDYNIELGHIETGTQTYFSIIFMPASVMTLLVILFRPLLTKMTFMWNDSQYKQVLKMVFKICCGVLGFTLFVILVACAIGIPVLSMLYGTGKNLNEYKAELLIIIGGGGILATSIMLDNVVTIFRKHHFLVISYLTTWIFTKLTANALVKQYGITGASYSYLASMCVLFIGILTTFIVCIVVTFYKGKTNQKKR